MTGGDDVMTIQEIAARLRVSRMTVYRLVKTGEMAGFQVGRSFRVYRKDYDAYVEEAKERLQGGTDAGFARVLERDEL